MAFRRRSSRDLQSRGRKVTIERLESRELLTLTPGATVSISAVAGAAFQGEVGTFTDSVATDTASGFTVTINWGDGQTSAGSVVAEGTSGYEVIGSHTYASLGTNGITSQVTAPDGSTARVLGTAAVADAPITVTGLNFNATSGTPATVNVADFRVANPSANLAEYQATIMWGDGTTSQSSTFLPDGQGGSLVTATHAYAKSGTFSTEVVVNHVTGTAASTGGGTATVAAAASLQPISQLVLGTPDLPIDATTQIAGSFRDFTYNPAAPPSFQASINWGDGHVSAGAVTLISTAASATGTTALYNVTGSNVYLNPGTYLVSITVQDQTSDATLIKSTAIISGPVLTPQGTTITATAGIPLPAATTRVATFLDTNAADFAPGSTPVATINWGDGQTTTGTVSASSQPGSFNVFGGHTYAAAGNFTLGVTLVNSAGQTATATGSAVVSAATINATGTTFPVSPDAPFTDTVASFSDNDPSATAANLKATINWGNGTTTLGTITGPGANGLFSVQGSFTYAATSPSGSFPVTVVITDPLGFSATATSKAIIVNAPTIAAIATTFAVTPGVPFKGVVASFTEFQSRRGHDQADGLDHLGRRPRVAGHGGGAGCQRPVHGFRHEPLRRFRVKLLRGRGHDH